MFKRARPILYSNLICKTSWADSNTATAEITQTTRKAHKPRPTPQKINKHPTDKKRAEKME